ncbi:SHOCT domain-containing protein [Spirosoma sp. BT704]|uniref:SHOCT domain-containing protein n=2 Tax=Spirosoma validum TaxID=2771355 RepID=A0A927B4J9_9BACT|nr:SHOCT domain-containing protein [Spirosoma validum]
MGTIGTKRSGFTVAAIVGTGGLVRYLIEVENALESSEIILPVRYRKNVNQANPAPISVADELLKLKQLLDAGALTQDEFNQQKKKLLSQ